MQVPRNSHRKQPDLLRGSRRNGILVVQRSEMKGFGPDRSPTHLLRSGSVAHVLSVVKKLTQQQALAVDVRQHACQAAVSLDGSEEVTGHPRVARPIDLTHQQPSA